MADLNSDPEKPGFDTSGEDEHRNEYMHSDYVLHQRKLNLLKIWTVIYPLLLYSLVLIITMYCSLMAIIVKDMFVHLGPVDQMTNQEYQEKMTEFVTQAKTDAKMRSYYETFEAYSPMVTMIANLLMLPIAILLLILDDYLRKKARLQYSRIHPEEKLPAVPTPVSDGICAGLSLLSGVGMCLAANLFVTLLKLNADSAGSSAGTRTYGVLYDIQNSIPFQILSVVILAAVVEELLFHGVVYRRMKNGSGFFFSMFFSSLIYASFYGTSAGFVFGFLVACGGAYLYDRTRNLKTPVLYHIFLNALTFVFSLLGVHTNAFFGSTRRIVLAFLIGIVLLAFTILIIEYYLPKPVEQTENKETT